MIWVQTFTRFCLHIAQKTEELAHAASQPASQPHARIHHHELFHLFRKIEQPSKAKQSQAQHSTHHHHPQNSLMCVLRSISYGIYLRKGEESAAAPSPLATFDSTSPPNPAETRHFSTAPLPSPSSSSSLPPIPPPPPPLAVSWWRKRRPGQAHVNSSARSREQRILTPPGGTPLPL